MALHNVQSKEMRLVLSSDAKPRLKWTSELHQRFIDAVDQLGGPEKATPKSLMRVMGIHGLTLYHLKSHLQKYRMGRSQQSQASHQNKQEDYGEKQRSHFTSKGSDGTKEQINESLQMTRALQMQMEVQRKLHEQIEVQRHMQLRIETQGKYIQSVLKKAQETLSEYGSCSIEAEHVKAQLSELVSMVDSGCPSSSLSSLTSSESSWRRDESQPNEADENYKQEKRNFFELQLMQMYPPVQKNQSESQANNMEKLNDKRFQSMETIDLNCKSLNDYDSGPRMIDLNL